MLRTPQPTTIPDPRLARFLFADKRMGLIWLAVRLYVGWQWLAAGWGKLNGSEGAWIGIGAGGTVTGFANGALKQTTGAHPSVQPFYAWFLQTVVVPHAVFWSGAIAYGETLVGLGLIFGLFTGLAAFSGGLLNANYLLAGAVSTNPMLFILATWLVLAWKVAGHVGLDYFALPLLGVPGAGGTLFTGAEPPVETRKPTAITA